MYFSYIGDGSSDPMITCERPALRVMAGALEFRTSSLEPLQQWPQPELQVAFAEARAAELPTLAPKPEKTSMKIRVTGREKSQLLHAMEAGDPLTIRFDQQTLEIPGLPKSMREGFVAKCLGTAS